MYMDSESHSPYRPGPPAEGNTGCCAPSPIGLESSAADRGNTTSSTRSFTQGHMSASTGSPEGSHPVLTQKEALEETGVLQDIWAHCEPQDCELEKPCCGVARS